VTFVLDTHVLLWWVDGSDRLTARHAEILDEIDEGSPAVLSDISLWEVATLVRLRKIELGLPLRDWLEQASAPPLVRRFGITPAVAAATADLPDEFPGDPADRIIAATTRVLGATLLTCDGGIIDSRAVPTT